MSSHDSLVFVLYHDCVWEAGYGSWCVPSVEGMKIQKVQQRRNDKPDENDSFRAHGSLTTPNDGDGQGQSRARFLSLISHSKVIRARRGVDSRVANAIPLEQ
jgi:hypothetical protein